MIPKNVLAEELENLRRDLKLITVLMDAMRTRRDALETLNSVLVTMMAYKSGPDQHANHEEVIRIQERLADVNTEIGCARKRKSECLRKIRELSESGS